MRRVKTTEESGEDFRGTSLPRLTAQGDVSRSYAMQLRLYSC